MSKFSPTVWALSLLAFLLLIATIDCLTMHSASDMLYARNLPYDAREQDLKAVFSKYGNVVDVDVIIDRDSGKVCLLLFFSRRDLHL